MSRKSIPLAFAALLAVISVAQTGCVTKGGGPFIGIFSIPIPVSAYLQDKQEQKFYEHKHYERAPILGPIPAGGPAVALDPPSDDEVMRAIERARPTAGGIPLLHETTRNNVRIVKEKIADYVDPPRFIPLIGPAQLHHAHYKCTVYFNEVTHVGWPVPHTLNNDEAVEVVYIDHNHMHMVGHVDGGVGGNY